MRYEPPVEENESKKVERCVKVEYTKAKEQHPGFQRGPPP